MRAPDLFRIFTAPLDGLGVPYMVTGSVAGLVYGEPRMTHDVDLVLALEDPDVDRVAAAFPGTDFYCPPVEVMRVELRRRQRGHFNLIHHATGFKADVYLKSDHMAHTWAFAHRRRTEPDGFWLAPPEYVIASKLAYFREGGSEKHLRDIRAIVAAQGDALDTDALDRLLEASGLRQLYAELVGPPR